MIEKIKWAGWILAIGLSLLFFVQSCQQKKRAVNPLFIQDTILVPGDNQPYLVQDTVLKPYKIYFHDSIPKIDSADVVKDYFASRVYRDTIKARDVTAVIEDSISANKIESHKVFIENSRDLQMTTLQSKPTAKLFMGGFAGYSAKNLLPVAGVSLSLITKKDIQYSYEYDALNRTHSIGLSWKIHVPKF